MIHLRSPDGFLMLFPPLIFRSDRGLLWNLVWPTVLKYFSLTSEPWKGQATVGSCLGWLRVRGPCSCPPLVSQPFIAIAVDALNTSPCAGRRRHLATWVYLVTVQLFPISSVVGMRLAGGTIWPKSCNVKLKYTAFSFFLCLMYIALTFGPCICHYYVHLAVLLKNTGDFRTRNSMSLPYEVPYQTSGVYWCWFLKCWVKLVSGWSKAAWILHGQKNIRSLTGQNGQ